MNQYKVDTIYSTFYIVADSWSHNETYVLFWKGKRILQSLLLAELSTPDNPTRSVTLMQTA